MYSHGISCCQTLLQKRASERRWIGWIGWVKCRAKSTLVGNCGRSGIHLEGCSGDMPLQFWSAMERMALSLWYPQKYNLDGNFEDNPRQVLYALGAISVYSGFSQGKPRTWALWSGPKESTDWAIETPENRWEGNCYCHGMLVNWLLRYKDYGMIFCRRYGRAN